MLTPKSGLIASFLLILLLSGWACSKNPPEKESRSLSGIQTAPEAVSWQKTSPIPAQYDDWLKGTKSWSSTEVKKEAYRLIQQGEGGIRSLLAHAFSPQWWHRLIVFEVLRDTPESMPQFLEQIRYGLQDEFKPVQFMAALAWVHHGGDFAIVLNLLLDLAASPHDHDRDINYYVEWKRTRLAAIEKLGKASEHRDRVAPVLRELATFQGKKDPADVDEDVDDFIYAARAAEALAELQPTDTPSLQALSRWLFHHWYSDPLDVAFEAAFEAAGKQAEAPLLSLLEHPEERARNAGVELLGRIESPDPSSLQKLCDLLKKEESPEVRRRTASVLKAKNLVDDTVIAQYITQLREEVFWEVNWHGDPDSVAALKEIGVMAVPQVAKLLNDKSRTIQWWAATILEEIGPQSEKALHDLIRSTQNAEDPRIRVFCIKTLGKVGDPSAVPALEESLNSSFNYVVLEAFTALARIGNDEAFSAMKRAFQKPENEALLECIRTIGTEASMESLPILIEALESPSTEINRASLETLDNLMKNSSSTGKIRSAIAESVQRIIRGENPASSITKVRQELDREFPFHGQFDRMVVEAKAGSQPVLKKLVSYLELSLGDHNFIPLCDELAAIGKPAVPFLVETLNKSEGQGLNNTLIALARMGPAAKEAEPSVSKLTKHKDEHIQKFAKIALDRIQGKNIRTGFWFDKEKTR